MIAKAIVAGNLSHIFALLALSEKDRETSALIVLTILKASVTGEPQLPIFSGEGPSLSI